LRFPKEDFVAKAKTRPTRVSAVSYLKAISDPARRKDCLTLLSLMKKATRTAPRMWGSSIVGFGQYHYRYQSGHEGDCFVIGFAPRSSAITLYISAGLDPFRETLRKLGPHKRGKGCLHLKSLEEIDVPTLTSLLTKAANQLPASATPQTREPR
jgi:Domain of unknown function (DU1801)